jgi:hypothetical protein
MVCLAYTHNYKPINVSLSSHTPFTNSKFPLPSYTLPTTTMTRGLLLLPHLLSLLLATTLTQALPQPITPPPTTTRCIELKGVDARNVATGYGYAAVETIDEHQNKGPSGNYEYSFDQPGTSQKGMDWMLLKASASAPAHLNVFNFYYEDGHTAIFKKYWLNRKDECVISKKDMVADSFTLRTAAIYKPVPVEEVDMAGP